MASGTISTLMKIGIIAEEMAPPRRMTGMVKTLFSIIAVAYSYFFIHVAFFGPPVEEVFRGTFFLGVAIMSLLLFKNRLRPIRDRAVWLDELFAFANLVMLCGAIAVWVHWQIGENEVKWFRYFNTEVLIVGLIGGVVGAAVYLFEGMRRTSGNGFSISDVLYVISIVMAVLWWVENVQNLRERSGSAVPALLFIYSVMMVSVSFEIARRIVGPLIPLLGFLFFIYSFETIAQRMPGILNYPGYDAETVMEFLMASTEGMFGLIANVFATFIVIFVVLGAFLEKTGLGAVIINTAYRMTGAKTGGPGLAAVVSSGFFGMISGSGVANVMTTGTFTIPLMKRVGYKSDFAGGVEAAASTGGAYMPPIMGAGAFLLAELTETSYFTIVKIAVIPAVLYYLSVGLMVYFRAVRDDLHGVPAEELPQWKHIIPRLHLMLPIPAMVFFLVIGDSPFLAAAKTIVLIIMLKLIDLLSAIPTARSKTSWKPYLAISFVVGILVFFFGMKIGAPFSWFVEDYVGIGIGDAGYWVVLTFILLKIGEIMILGPIAVADREQDRSTTEGMIGVSEDDQDLRGLGDAFKELVRTTWVSMETGARNTLVVSCITGVLGILLSAATKSDLPGRVASLLVEASGGYLPITIILVIIAGYIVGMGLPIAASYVILAIFAVGALTDLGVPTLAAHMISYWVAVVSAVTPPVALAAFAASSIAQSDPVKTGNQALKMASMILIMPFLFVYTPLLLIGSTFDIGITVVACLLGVVAWAKFFEGFGNGRHIPFERLLWLVAAACLLLPVGNFVTFVFGSAGDLRYQAYIVGAVILGGVYAYQYAGRRSAPA
ncbi:MAG: TRAP transporter fused permease subunit [Alphaproteobacteria bacterium]|nr:TRAP transporter fused permease subunit [Alphaproteobacteria bacterium]